MPKFEKGLMVAILSSVALHSSFAFAQQPPRNAVVQDCEDLDFSIKREGSPYHYTNPNEGCGISLSLDGLPEKTGDGYSFNGNDACRTIQGVVSNLEGRLNERLQGALGAIGDVVSPEELAQIGGAAGIDTSALTGVMENGVSFDRTLNDGLTNTLGKLATEEGRSELADDLKDGAADAARDSLEESQQNVSTPSINDSQGAGESQSTENWSIFD
ncbi:hypothetical protein [Marinobacter sp.]|uniref:hypothetical protein n=1 Tax=Marinobacter sp. TaxID=50741 RepID=UPI003569A763